MPKSGPIVIIEDDTDDCEIFDAAIKQISAAIQLECSNDCVDILNKLESFAPQLIFIDLHLPLKDGLDCLVDIHNAIALCNIPIIMYTGISSPIDIERAATLGAKIYFEKPSSLGELVTHLREVLSMDWHTPQNIKPLVLKDGEYIPMETFLQANKL